MKKTMKPTQHDSLLTSAVRHHLREGRGEQAQIILGAWQRRAPQAAAPAALQALLDLSSGNLDRAQSQVQRAIAADSSAPLGYFALAQVYMAQGQAAQAQIAVERALLTAPEDAECVRLAAHISALQGNPGQAMSLLRKNLAGKQADVPTRLMLAELLMHQSGGAAEAEGLCREACTEMPYLAAAWSLHGVALAALGDQNAAQESIGIALLLDPDNTLYLLQSAQLVLDLPRPDAAELAKAAQSASRVCALAPHDVRGPGVWAAVLRRQGKLDAAVNVMQTAVNAFPEDSSLPLTLAQMCGEAGLFDKGLAAARQAATREGADPESAYTVMSEIHLRQGNLTQAFAALESGMPKPGEHWPAPLQAELVRGKVINLHASGLRQCLPFVRYVPALAAMGLKVQITAPSFVAPLLSRVQGVWQVDTDGGREADANEPLWRLPALLGLADADHCPPSPPYLLATEAATDRVQLLQKKRESPCVFLDLGPDVDPELVAELAQWLQGRGGYAVVPSEQAEYWRELGIECVTVNGNDIEMLAGWMTRADDIVVGDTALGHLAGGLGLAARVFLPLAHTAIWGHDASSTPWYPQLRLFRQSADASWSAAVAQALD